MPKAKKLSVKDCLKQAKSCIDNEEWESASKLCASALKQDQSSYFGWVFMGVSMAHIDMNKSIQSYQKAIAIQHTQSTAWQGLIKLLSDISNPSNEQIQLLCESLATFSDEILSPNHEKQESTLLQLIKLYNEQCNYKKTIDYYISLINRVYINDEDKLNSTLETAMNIFISWKKNKSNDENSHDVNEYGLSLIKLGNENFREFLSPLFYNEVKHLDNDIEIERISCELITLVPYYWDPIEYFCIKIQTDNYSHSIYNFNSLFEIIKEKFFTKPIYHIYKGILLLKDDNSDDKSDDKAIYTLSNYLKQYSYPLGWESLSSFYLTKKSSLVFNSVKCGVQSIKQIEDKYLNFKLSDLKAKLLLIMSNGYEYFNKYHDAIKICNSISNFCTNESYIQIIKQKLADLYFKVNNIEKAKPLYEELLNNHINEHNNYYYLGRIHFINNNFDSAEEYLNKALSLCNSNGEYYYWLAEVYWNKGNNDNDYRNDKKYVLNNLLRSAKLNSSSSDVFASLGRYYEYIPKDIERSKKCYQKSLLINSFNDLASKQLSNIYINENNQENAVRIYQDVVKKDSGVEWAWRKLAIYYSSKGLFQEALNCLQSILRYSPNDSETIESLGFVYKKQGMYDAALRVFEGLLNNNINSPSIIYNIANIQLTLGMYEESIENYNIIINNNNHNHNNHNNTNNDNNNGDYEFLNQSFIDISQCYYFLSQEEFNDGMYIRSGISLQNAAFYILKVNNDNNDIEIIKLKGDIFLAAFYYSEEYLLSFIKHDSSKIKNIKQKWILKGSEVYKNAINNIKDNCYLYYDYGISFWQLSQLSNNSNEKIELLNKSKELFKQAITLQPSEVKFWNALGSITENDKIQQHIFIRALDIDPNNAETWCNLMTFYIKHKNFELANECYEKTIIYDPDLPKLWTCYALMKEIQYNNNNESKTKKNNKTNHLTKKSIFEYYQFAFIMNPKSNFVKKSLIYFSDDPYFPLYTLHKTVGQNPNDYHSWNLLGLLQEQISQISSALKSFKTSIDLLLTLTSDIYNGNLSDLPSEQILFDSTPISVQLLQCKLNYARCLVKSKQYKESLPIYEELLSTLNNDLSNHISYYYLALYHSGNIKKAFSIINNEIKKYPNSIQFIHDYCRFKFNNNETSDSYSSILSFATSNKKHESWRLLCAISVSCNEDNSLHHIKHLQTHPSGSVEDILLEASYFISKKQILHAKRTLCRALHVEPYNSIIRIYYINFLCKFYSSDSKSIWQAVKNTEFISNQVNISHDLLCYQWTCIANALLVLGKERLISVNEIIRKAKSSIQTALRYNPQDYNARYTAACVAYSIFIIDKRKYQIQSSLQMIKKTILFLSTLSTIPSFYINSCYLMIIDIELYSNNYKNANTILEKVKGMNNINNNNNNIEILQMLEYRIQFKLGELKNDQIIDIIHNSIKTKRLNNSIDLVYILSSNNYNNTETIHSIFKSILESKMDMLTLSDRLLLLLNISIYYYRNREYKLALPIIDLAYKLSGRKSDIFILLKSAIHIALKDWKNAMQSIKRCIIVNPYLPLANFLFMQIHIHIRKYDAAESDALYEIDNNPLFHLPYILLSYLAKLAKKNKISNKFISQGKHLFPIQSSLHKMIECQE